MQPTAEMTRSTWWAFAVGGAAGLVAAAAAGLALGSAGLVTGAWQLVAGIALLVAAARAPGGVGSAVPFLGLAAAGVVLGAVGVLLPSLDPRIALIAIGIWGVLAGAGYLAVARIARAFRVHDGGLLRVAWVAIATGIATSTLPTFGLGASTLAAGAALALTGAITIVASLRLRILPDEAPPVISRREARRRERRSPGG